MLGPNDPHLPRGQIEANSPNELYSLFLPPTSVRPINDVSFCSFRLIGNGGTMQYPYTLLLEAVLQANTQDLDKPSFLRYLQLHPPGWYLACQGKQLIWEPNYVSTNNLIELEVNRKTAQKQRGRPFENTHETQELMKQFWQMDKEW